MMRHKKQQTFIFRLVEMPLMLGDFSTIEKFPMNIGIIITATKFTCGYYIMKVKAFMI